MSTESFPIHVNNLSVAYQDKPVLSDVSFSLPSGILAALVGPNGAGKSTTLKACIDLVPRTAGNIHFFGKQFSQVRNRIAYVPQRESVDWDFPISALDVVCMGLYKQIGWFLPVLKRHRQLGMQALADVGLIDFADRQINMLSGGQQQRVFLARALVKNADVYLLDEPFASVDATTEHTILSVLKNLRSRGKTILCVHHNLESVRDYFEYTIFLNMHVINQGPTKEIFTKDNLLKTYGERWLLLDDVVTK